MIPYNITPGTKVRNIKTGKEHKYKCRVTINNYAPKALLTGIRATHWENFSRNYELANQAKPSLMTSIG
jgi:hypothetical protein